MEEFIKRLDELEGRDKARAEKLIERYEELNYEDIPESLKQRRMYEVKKQLELLLPTSERMREKAKAIRNVGALLTQLMGDRTIRQTSGDSGVAASYISGILKGTHLPSAETLKRLTAPEARPQNGITLEDLMLAAGYQVDYVKEAVNEAIFEGSSVDDAGEAVETPLDGKTMARLATYAVAGGRLSTSQERHDRIMQEASKYESLATGIVYRALAEKGLKFSSSNDVVGVRGFRPDMAIYVADKQPILEWWFEFKYLGDTNGINGNRGYVNIKHILSQVMFIEPNLARKFSIVINNEEDYERMLGYKDKLSYRGDLSIILVDVNSFSIVREEYLSHYELYDKKSEFYII